MKVYTKKNIKFCNNCLNKTLLKIFLIKPLITIVIINPAKRKKIQKNKEILIQEFLY